MKETGFVLRNLIQVTIIRIYIIRTYVRPYIHTYNQTCRRKIHIHVYIHHIPFWFQMIH